MYIVYPTAYTVLSDVRKMKTLMLDRSLWREVIGGAREHCTTRNKSGKSSHNHDNGASLKGLKRIKLFPVLCLGGGAIVIFDIDFPEKKYKCRK